MAKQPRTKKEENAEEAAEKKTEDVAEEDATDDAEEVAADEEEPTEEKTAEEKSEDAENAKEKTEEEENTEGEAKPDAFMKPTKPVEVDDSEPEVKEPPKPVLKKFTAKLELSNTNHGLQAVDGDEKTAVWEQLKKLDQIDADRLAKDESFNNLEAFIYDIQDKLYREGWTEAINDEDKEVLTTVFSGAADWLWDVEDPTTIMYQDKLAELKKETREWARRVEEQEKRPEIVEKLQSQLTVLKKIFLEDYTNHTGEGLALSQEDIFTISEKMDTTEEWLNEKLAEQKSKKSYDEPALKISEIEVKGRVLYTAADKLVKKVKYWKPPKPTVPPTIETPKADEKSEDGEEINADDEEKTEDKTEDKEEKTTGEPVVDEPAASADDVPVTETPEPVKSEEPATHAPEEL